jgi:hypothetical protein
MIENALSSILSLYKIFLVLLVIFIVCLFHYVLTAINIHLFIFFILFICAFLRSPHANAGMKQHECGRTQPLLRMGHDHGKLAVET